MIAPAVDGCKRLSPTASSIPAPGWSDDGSAHLAVMTIFARRCPLVASSLPPRRLPIAHRQVFLVHSKSFFDIRENLFAPLVPSVTISCPLSTLNELAGILPCAARLGTQFANGRSAARSSLPATLASQYSAFVEEA
jgi:hypothetical protein